MMGYIDIEKLNNDISDLQYKLDILSHVKMYVVTEENSEISTIEDQLSECLSKRLNSSKVTKILDFVKKDNIKSASATLNSFPETEWAFARKLMYQLRILRFNPSSDSGMKDALSNMIKKNQLSEADQLWFSRHGW